MQKLCLFKVLKISIHSYCDSHVGGQENAHKPIFPNNIIENSPTSFARNSVSVGPNDLKCGTETRFGRTCVIFCFSIGVVSRGLLRWKIEMYMTFENRLQNFRYRRYILFPVVLSRFIKPKVDAFVQ